MHNRPTMRLWKAIAVQAAVAAGTANAADCERVEYLSVPAAGAFKKPGGSPKARPGPRRPAAVAPKAAKPAPTYRRIVTRYDCPPPSSRPGGPPIIPGVPYVGTPPMWGYPPGWIPTGPPDTPRDFPPGASIPPAGLAPPSTRGFVPGDTPPVDVPEPPTWSMLLFGLALLFTRRFSRPTRG